MLKVNEDDATISHEASVGKIGEDQIFYLMSRGFSESDALSLIVGGFIEPFTKELPMEYAVELNRLVKLEMEDSGLIKTPIFQITGDKCTNYRL
jgi:Fe-S cluster assembly protein SufB